MQLIIIFVSVIVVAIVLLTIVFLLLRLRQRPWRHVSSPNEWLGYDPSREIKSKSPPPPPAPPTTVEVRGSPRPQPQPQSQQSYMPSSASSASPAAPYPPPPSGGPSASPYSYPQAATPTSVTSPPPAPGSAEQQVWSWQLPASPSPAVPQQEGPSVQYPHLDPASSSSSQVVPQQEYSYAAPPPSPEKSEPSTQQAAPPPSPSPIPAPAAAPPPPPTQSSAPPPQSPGSFSIPAPPPSPEESEWASPPSYDVLEDDSDSFIEDYVAHRGIDAHSSSPQPVEEAATQDKTDVRYSDVSFPDHTVAGRMEALRVAITRKAVSERAVPLALERPSDDTQPMKVDAYVVISPLDFDLHGSNVQTITIFPNADSSPVIFKLVAKSEGTKTIAVEFFQNTRYLGRAELETTVGQQPRVQLPVSAQAMLEMSARQLEPDLTILFDRVPVGNDRHYYRYRLLSPIRELNLYFEEFRSPETSIMPQGLLEQTFTQLNRMLSSDTPGEFFFGRLNSIGMNLYRSLFSDDFKRLYWNSLRNKVKSIVIISFEPWIPWELLKPFNPETNEAEDGFLCEKYDLTRWLAGAGFPDIMSLEQLGLIVSASELDSAKLEAEEIKGLFGAKVRAILSSGPAVYRLLRTNDFYGLHFACHGSFNKDNPDMSTLSLEDGTWLSPIDIDGDGLAFGKNKPLVFLNACETGRSGYALTGMGGWAEAFVGRAKCSGFIGSIWKANDESACKFAVAFYRNLLDGKTVAEAARLARLNIKQAGDPTWLSYTVYANPLAHLNIDKSLQPDHQALPSF